MDNSTNCTWPPASAFPRDVFTLEERRYGAILLHVLAAIYAFGSLAIVCNYYFISAVEAISIKLGISGDVAGATFMAIGTSAPELITACIGVFVTRTNLGLETVAGSTVFNMFFITALVILAASSEIRPEYWPVMRDLGFFIIVNVILFYACFDGIVTWYETMVVMLIYLIYIMTMAVNSRIKDSIQRLITKDEKKGLYMTEGNTSNEGTEYQPIEGSSERRSSLSLHSALLEEQERSYQSQLSWPEGMWQRLAYIVFFPIKLLFFLTIPDCNHPGCWENLYLLTFFTSGVWIGLSCYLMVWMVEVIGLTISVPEPVLAITALAIGTSLPDCLASVVAARKGYHTMAISNILGSNIFDLTCISLPWLLKIISSGDIRSAFVVSNSSLLFTIISLLTSSVVLIIVFFIFRWKLSRYTAYVLLGKYLIYVLVTILYEFNVFGLVNLPYCDDM